MYTMNTSIQPTDIYIQVQVLKTCEMISADKVLAEQLHIETSLTICVTIHINKGTRNISTTFQHSLFLQPVFSGYSSELSVSSPYKHFVVTESRAGACFLTLVWHL